MASTLKPIFFALLLLGGVSQETAAQQMHTCRTPDGRVTFQQLPCDDVPQAVAPAAAPLVAAPTKPAPVPAPAAAPVGPAAPAAAAEPVIPALLPMTVPRAGPTAAAKLTPGSPELLTRGKREVIEFAALLERCRADQPGFADRGAAQLQRWRQRHAATLNEFDKVLATRVKEARRGPSPLPLEFCTDDLLARAETMARPPDTRMDSAEKTWQLFLTALAKGDRATATRCLTGKAEARWKERVDRYSDAELRNMAATIRAFKVQWGDDYLKEALAAQYDNKLLPVTFEKFNDEWRISAM